MASSSAGTAVWCCSTCGAIYHKDFPRCPNDGGEVVVSLVDPILGKTIGRYVIDRLVGEGGMGRVYEAHHTTLANKRYAVKVLLGDAGATPTMRKRFAKEAESASRLVHANVVAVTDYGATEGGLPYIVMDFLDGRSIAELIEDGPIAVPRAIRLARAMCEGLVYAHEAGVVHRDLKPANVIVVRTPAGDEVPRIADFGLAQTVDDKDARLTTTGMAMGTPAYAAPEQMAGKRVDHRADLYALGMTMFEMLSGGVLPFKGGPMDVAHREGAPRSAGVPRRVPRHRDPTGTRRAAREPVEAARDRSPGNHGRRDRGARRDRARARGRRARVDGGRSAAHDAGATEAGPQEQLARARRDRGRRRHWWCGVVRDASAGGFTCRSACARRCHSCFRSRSRSRSRSCCCFRSRSRSCSCSCSCSCSRCRGGGRSGAGSRSHVPTPQAP